MADSGKYCVQDAVQLAGGRQVPPERLLDHDPRVPGAARLGQVPRHDGEQARRDRQVVHGPGGVAQLAAQGAEGRRVVVVAVDVAEQADELPGRLVRPAAVRLDAGQDPGAEPLQVPARPGDADDRHVEVPVPHHLLERRVDLLDGEVAGRAEEDQGIGLFRVHEAPRWFGRVGRETRPNRPPRVSRPRAGTPGPVCLGFDEVRRPRSGRPPPPRSFPRRAAPGPARPARGCRAR